MGDHELVVTPLEPYENSHGYEEEKPSLQVDLLIHSSSEDKVKKREEQFTNVELNQCEGLSLDIPIMI